MISARRALMRHVGAFFDEHLRGVWDLNSAVMLPAEPAQVPEGWRSKRRPPYGKDAEKVVLAFGPSGRQYRLTVCSTSEVPPLGLVRIDGPRGSIEGPLDVTTWARIGIFIRQQKGKAA